MTVLYHPDMPGQSTQRSGFRRSGWVEWDDLTREQQNAHEAAVKASGREHAQAEKRRADWQAAKLAAAPKPEPRPAKKQPPVKAAPVKKATAKKAAKNAAPPKPAQTPKSGDTKKEQ